MQSWKMESFNEELLWVAWKESMDRELVWRTCMESFDEKLLWVDWKESMDRELVWRTWIES